MCCSVAAHKPELGVPLRASCTALCLQQSWTGRQCCPSEQVTSCKRRPSFFMGILVVTSSVMQRPLRDNANPFAARNMRGAAMQFIPWSDATAPRPATCSAQYQPQCTTGLMIGNAHHACMSSYCSGSSTLMQNARGKVPSIMQWPGLASGVPVVLHATRATNCLDTASMHNHTRVPSS